jgi:hypothetical protein
MNLKCLFLTALTLIGTVFLSGCVTPPAKREAVFNESEFAPYDGTGSSTIMGQAFLKTVGGEVRYGAGCQVVMVPVTSYSTEEYERAIIRGERLEPPDSSYATYVHTTIADGNGNFEFSEIPSGGYYLACLIQWEYQTENGLTPTGGTVYGRVSVSSNKTAKVILTR